MQSAVETPATNLVYLHSKRKGWGLAALAWETDGKRGYLFEDGSERTFAKEYCGMFEPIRPTTETAQRLLAEVKRERAAKAASSSSSGVSKPKDERTVDEQIAVFRKLFEGGFVGDAWRKKHRGTGGRRLKRHRDAAIADARQQLSVEAIDELLGAARYEEVLRRATDVLAATDLVTKTQLKTLRNARATVPLVTALRDYLHGDDPEGTRFGAFARQLGRNSEDRSNWPVFTALRALVQPEAHLCVRPSAMRAQANIVGADISGGKRITGRRYLKYLAIAESLRDQLIAAGLKPTDMLDVYDFMWVTTRPANASLYDEVRAESAAQPDAGEAETPAANSEDSDESDSEAA